MTGTKAAPDLERDVREAVAHFQNITPSVLLNDELFRQTMAMVFLTGMEAAAELAHNEKLLAAVRAVQKETKD